MPGITLHTDPRYESLSELPEATRIEIAELAPLFEINGLPESDELADVVWVHLNLMRATCHASERLDSSINDRYNAAAKAFAELQSLLPVLIGDAQHTLTHAQIPQPWDDAVALMERTAFRQTRLQTLQRLAGALSASTGAITPMGAGKRRALWHEDAKMLATILLQTARADGQDLDFQNATAPAVLFIHHALTLVGIGHGTGGSALGNIAKLFSREGGNRRRTGGRGEPGQFEI